MEAIEEFLLIDKKYSARSNGDGSGDGSGFGYGYGYGFGDGDGDGSGFGYGYGFGDGDGDGSGFGDGDGDGSGYGDGIIVFNNQKVHIIDSISTIITSIKNNVAKGFILQSDFTLIPCFIVKENNQFAHGDTLREAFKSLQEKLYVDYSIEERIEKFKEFFTDFSKKYKASDFFTWHNLLN
jgi:hypothetical protein